MADVLINGCLISWKFIGKVRKKCGGDKLTTIECFWRARHMKTAQEIMRYVQAGFRLPPTKKAINNAPFLPGEAWKKGTTIPYNFSPTKERMERGGKEMIARWWQTCTGPGNMAPVAFNIEDIVKLKDINQILLNR